MPLQATSGAASQDAYGGNGVAVVPNFIEDCFQTWLYTGTGALQTITNGIDLSTKGGLVWLKSRSATYNHYLQDTTRGIQNTLTSNDTSAQSVGNDIVNSVSTTGFVVQSYSGGNNSGSTYASWTWRKQPKFFDIQTWTGSGANRTISHSLGSVPACIIVKRTDTTAAWAVYHRSLANTQYLVLNTTAAAATGATWWNSTTPTSAVFSVGTDASVNASGGTYVAYIFAHDAGGFGLAGTDNVISCGSYTGVTYPNSLEVTIGFEPQFVIIKNSNTASDWTMWDTMRGMAVIPAANDAQAQILNPNTNAVESIQPGIFPTATGFVVKNGLTAISSPSDKMIYIAIRRGPMKVPTTGSSVFTPIVRNGTAANATVTGVGFPVDLAFTSRRAASHLPVLSDRLRGAKKTLSSSGTYDEQTETIALTSFASMDGVSFGADNTGYFNGFNNANGASYVNWFFRRAPSFFDEVCYTGTGSATTQAHNLQAVPELMIVKRRNSATYGEWFVYTATLGNAKYQLLNTTQASTTANSGIWNLTTPTSTIMSVGSDLSFSASPYVAYLFATCAGVSKVGSYTGTGTTKQIDCGFTAGARFVLIKRTDSTGDWYVWDTARGIISGDDPYLLINTEDAEVTNTDYIDPYSAGFEISSTAPAAINASAGTYIFLAIA